MSHVIVVGGGAAGMFAAIAAAKNGHQVTLYEKNEKLGKKIFITGKGRCNITNAADMEAIALSILDVVLHFTGYLHHIVLAWIAFGLSVLLWSGTMIIGDRKAKNELKRKLHI